MSPCTLLSGCAQFRAADRTAAVRIVRTCECSKFMWCEIVARITPLWSSLGPYHSSMSISIGSDHDCVAHQPQQPALQHPVSPAVSNLGHGADGWGHTARKGGAECLDANFAVACVSYPTSHVRKQRPLARR